MPDKTYKVNDTTFHFWCPGCNSAHGIKTGRLDMDGSLMEI